jgi:hypothetical protein
MVLPPGRHPFLRHSGTPAAARVPGIHGRRCRRWLCSARPQHGARGRPARALLKGSGRDARAPSESVALFRRPEVVGFAPPRVSVGFVPPKHSMVGARAPRLPFAERERTGRPRSSELVALFRRPGRRARVAAPAAPGVVRAVLARGGFERSVCITAISLVGRVGCWRPSDSKYRPLHIGMSSRFPEGIRQKGWRATS